MNLKKKRGNKRFFRRTAALVLALALIITALPVLDADAAKKKSTKSSQTNKLHLEYSFGTPSFEAGSYGYQVLLDDAVTFNESGMPDLPSKTVTLLLPQGKTVKNAKVSKSGAKTYDNMLIAPSVGFEKVTTSDGQTEEETSLSEEDAASAGQGSQAEDSEAAFEKASQTEQTAVAGSVQEETADAADSVSDNALPSEDDEQTAADEETGDGGVLISEDNETPEGVSFNGDEPDSEELDEAGKKDKTTVAKKVLSDKIDLTNSDIFNQSVYSGLATYPAASASEGSVQTVRGFSVYTITLYPMTYSGTTLTYYDKMSLDLTFEAADSETLYIPTEDDLEFLGDDIDVSQYKSTYFAAAAKAKTGKTIAGSGQIDYMIITNKAMSGTFQKLADYKASKGLRSAVVTTEKIYKKYKGYDKAEKIRNFIKDAYSKNRVKYVLLGGDGDNKIKKNQAVIPTRLLYCKAVASGEKPTYIASDVYYACLDGTYDSNKNHKYGEEKDGTGGKDVDLLADVYVGRAPVDNKKEAQNFVTKTIAYEKEEKSAKALMIGERLDGNISCSVELAAQLQNIRSADTITDTIRKLRDEKIKPEYVTLYYDVNDFVKSVYLDNLSLLGETVSLLTEYEPVIEEYLTTGTTERTLTAADIACLQDYCKEFGDAIADSSRSCGRKQQLIEELNHFRTYLGECENLTYAEMFENSFLCRDASDVSSASDFSKLDSIYGKTYKEEIRLGSKANDMTTKGIPSKYKVETLYDKDQDSGSWTKEQLLAKLNASPEMINHLGHANVDSLMRLSIKEIQSLKNERPFFFYSQGCYDGSFDNCNANGKYSKTDSIAEELLVSNAKSGAFACVVNSRYGWYNSDPSSTKGPSQIFDRLFWQEAMYGKNKSLGAILAKSRQDKQVTGNLKDSTYGAVLRYCFYEINLLGDPETKLQDFNDPRLAQPSLKVKRSGTKSTLTWNKVAGAGGYAVYRSTSKNGTYTKLGSVSGTSYTDTKAKKGKTYYYKVAALKKVSKTQYSRYSNPVKAGK